METCKGTCVAIGKCTCSTAKLFPHRSSKRIPTTSISTKSEATMPNPSRLSPEQFKNSVAHVLRTLTPTTIRSLAELIREKGYTSSLAEATNTELTERTLAMSTYACLTLFTQRLPQMLLLPQNITVGYLGERDAVDVVLAANRKLNGVKEVKTQQELFDELDARAGTTNGSPNKE